jgi:hypothetical protein
MALKVQSQYKHALTDTHTYETRTKRTRAHTPYAHKTQHAHYTHKCTHKTHSQNTHQVHSLTHSHMYSHSYTPTHLHTYTLTHALLHPHHISTIHKQSLSLSHSLHTPHSLTHNVYSTRTWPILATSRRGRRPCSWVNFSTSSTVVSTSVPSKLLRYAPLTMLMVGW